MALSISSLRGIELVIEDSIFQNPFFMTLVRVGTKQDEAYVVDRFDLAWTQRSVDTQAVVCGPISQQIVTKTQRYATIQEYGLAAWAERPGGLLNC